MALDIDAVASANSDLWAAHAELEGRQLNSSPEDAAYRREWTEHYRRAADSNDDDSVTLPPPERPRDAATLARLRASLLPTEPPSATKPCPLEIKHLRLGVFFDGTNNNKFRDETKQCQTNVVRLYHLYMSTDDDNSSWCRPDPPNIARRKLYIVGVGALDRARLKKAMQGQVPWREVGSVDDGAMSVAVGTAKNISRAIPISTVSDVVSGSAETTARLAADLGNLVGGGAGAGAKARVNNAFSWVISECQKVPSGAEKTVDVYGFSRGSALARTFVNLMNQVVKPRLANFRVRFVGIFDTVASFKHLRVFGSEAEQNFGLDGGDADKIYHCVALNEYRTQFPLTSAPGYDHIYAGAHADVGGGYAPLGLPDDDNPQVKENHLSFVPLKDVHSAGKSAGVDMTDLAALAETGGVDIESIRRSAAMYIGPVLSAPDQTDKVLADTERFANMYIHDSARISSITNFPNVDISFLHIGYKREVNIPKKKHIASPPPDFVWS